MPIREYICVDESKSCPHCRQLFERLEKMEEAPLAVCPDCGSPVHRALSAPSFQRHVSNLDDRAKRAGFHKLKRLGKGEYEKQY